MKININKLLLAMANACITIGELSSKSGISRTALNNFTTGKGNPKPATIGKIAKALNISVEDLIKDNERMV
jgi:transcriptional regulator with XRE-family HTH domain